MLRLIECTRCALSPGTHVCDHTRYNVVHPAAADVHPLQFAKRLASSEMGCHTAVMDMLGNACWARHEALSLHWSICTLVDQHSMA